MNKGQLLPTDFLSQEAEVRTRSANGSFGTVAEAALSIRLGHLRRDQAQTGAERAELAAIRHAIWPASYVMPEGARLIVDGNTWQTVRGTFNAPKDHTGAVVYRSCDVVRV